MIMLIVSVAFMIFLGVLNLLAKSPLNYVSAGFCFGMTTALIIAKVMS